MDIILKEKVWCVGFCDELYLVDFIVGFFDYYCGVFRGLEGFRW